MFLAFNVVTLHIFSAPWRRGGPDGKRRPRRQQPVSERRPLAGRTQDVGQVLGGHLAEGRADVERHSLSLLVDMISSNPQTLASSISYQLNQISQFCSLKKLLPSLVIIVQQL